VLLQAVHAVIADIDTLYYVRLFCVNQKVLEQTISMRLLWLIQCIKIYIRSMDRYLKFSRKW